MLPVWPRIALGAVPALGFLIALWWVVLGVGELWDAVRIRSPDGMNVTDVEPGYAFVNGAAEQFDSTVTAPFTGTECLAYEAGVQRWRDDPHSEGKPRWRSDYTDRQGSRLLLAGATGRVAVDTDDASFDVEYDHTHVIDSRESPAGPYREFVDDHDLYLFDDQGVSEAQEIRYFERRIESGDELFVEGMAGDASDIGGARALISEAFGDRAFYLPRRSTRISDTPIEPSTALTSTIRSVVFRLFWVGVSVVFVYVFLFA